MSDDRSTAPPVIAGAIDIGSNALRLLVARYESGHRIETLESLRVSLRLGTDAFLTGRIGAVALSQALRALSDLRDRALALGAIVIRAVATSAVRESSNGAELVRRSAEELGIAIRVISGAEEAQLVFLAVRERLTLGAAKWLLVDLGGGSLELSLVSDAGIHWTESHPIGAVRFLAELDDESAEKQGRLLEESIGSLRIPSLSSVGKVQGLIASGGNIESLAKLAGAVLNEGETCIVQVSSLRSVTATLARLSYGERVAQLHLREDRADVILPAALVYARIAALAGIAEIVVPFVGVKEGLVMEIIEESTGRSSESRERTDQAWQAALSLGRKYLFEEAHACQVGRLALGLFDQLRILHKLEEVDRRIITAAALLHDVGTFVDYDKHHKHSYYLISQAELPDFAPHEKQLVALVARYHRKSDPSTKHAPYARLSPSDQTRVARLAALLRLADALDREHLQKVNDLRVELGAEVVVLHIDGADDLLLERWSIQKKSKLFTRLFKLAVHLRPAKAD